MAGALRKTMVYLGLAEEDDHYDDYEDYDEPDRERPRGRDREEDLAPARESAPSHAAPTAPVRRVERERPMGSDRPRSGGATAAAVVLDDEPEEKPRHAEVTPLRRTPVREVVDDVEVSGVHRITTIHPRTYNEATNIGRSFREGTPVIMNLSDLDDADAKRLVDFAAGLVFGLQGSFERVTNKVFLLSPADVEVTSEHGEPAKAERAVFNQS